MASEQQIQQMLDLMQQQMDTVRNLQDENNRLRENPSPQGNANVSAKYATKKTDRPVVNTGIDDREWALFVDTWVRYKRMCNLDAVDTEVIRLELRASCSNEVNRLLFEYVGSVVLDDSTEEQLLQHIKTVAVKTVHKEVHRRAFHTMLQDQGESVTKFASRLKAKAFLCEYEIPCSCCDPPKMQSYADEEVSQRLVAGLANQEHQRRLLSEVSTLTTLEKKISRLQILEMTDQSTSTLNTPPQASDAALGRSRYKQQKTNSDSSVKCRFCGKTAHPGGKFLERTSCPARNKVCFKCKARGHLSSVCEKNANVDNADASATDATDSNTPSTNESAAQSITSGSDVSFSFGAREKNQDFQKALKYHEAT